MHTKFSDPQKAGIFTVAVLVLAVAAALVIDAFGVGSDLFAWASVWSITPVLATFDHAAGPDQGRVFEGGLADSGPAPIGASSVVDRVLRHLQLASARVWPASIAHATHNSVSGMITGFTLTSSPLLVNGYLLGEFGIRITAAAHHRSAGQPPPPPRQRRPRQRHSSTRIGSRKPDHRAASRSSVTPAWTAA
jgi:hypothetical protein